MYRANMALWKPIHTCMYEGEKNNQGLPHGSGRWFDDNPNGEVLTGHWANGVPIGPFISRTCGKGDGFTAIRVAYFIATDDDFKKNARKPSNENAPKIGLATVECSVNGSFFRHLPRAKQMFDPIEFGCRDGCMSVICDQLIHLDVDGKNIGKNLKISVTGSRGSQVGDHFYRPPNGSPSLQDVREIIVDVRRKTKKNSSIPVKNLFMPSASIFNSNALHRQSSFKNLFSPRGSSILLDGAMVLESIAIENEEESSAKILENIVEEHKEESLLSYDSSDQSSVSSALSLDTDPSFASNLDSDRMFEGKSVKEEEMSGLLLNNQKGGEPEEVTPSAKGSNRKKPRKISKLEVRNWAPIQRKEALIFFPGFKVSMDAAVCSFGQFMAMTQLTSYVFPIVYAWPSGTVFSYRDASFISASQKNKDNFHKLLCSLSEAGVQTIHLMSHSMGSQNLLAMFENKDDNDLHSRSDSSLMFQQDSTFGDEIEVEGEGKQLMVCKNIVLMNPDFPLKAFVDRAFFSIRRICDNITITGDREDVALRFGSKVINGLCNRMGRKQSHLLTSNTDLKSYSKKLEYLSAGYDIHLLHFPGKVLPTTESGETNLPPSIKNALIFQNIPPTLSVAGEKLTEKKWLDIDVIDTTSLDTNMKGIRHSGFNTNPIILKDLAELILEGKRASKRSSLLQREGNMFTYSHTPSFIAM